MQDLPLDVGHFSGWPLLQLKVTGFGADGDAGCNGIGVDAADFTLYQIRSWNGIGLEAVSSKGAAIMKHILLKFILKYINGGT